MAVGARLSPGDVVLSVLDGTPGFTIAVAQGSALDSSKPIEVTFGGETVQAVVASSSDSGNGYTTWSLTRTDGSPVCGDQCGQVPLNPDQAVYPARQVLTPEVSGPGVPAAAVWFNADGTAYLVRSDGTRLPVTILGEGQGGVVVDGVAIGTVVVLAGGAATPAGAPATGGVSTAGVTSAPAGPGGTPS